MSDLRFISREYRIVSGSVSEGPNQDRIEERLVALGREGWRVVAFSRHQYGGTWTLERAIPETRL